MLVRRPAPIIDTAPDVTRPRIEAEYVSAFATATMSPACISGDLVDLQRVAEQIRRLERHSIPSRSPPACPPRRAAAAIGRNSRCRTWRKASSITRIPGTASPMPRRRAWPRCRHRSNTGHPPRHHALDRIVDDLLPFYGADAGRHRSPRQLARQIIYAARSPASRQRLAETPIAARARPCRPRTGQRNFRDSALYDPITAGASP